jgi:hypothetical protein
MPPVGQPNAFSGDGKNKTSRARGDDKHRQILDYSFADRQLDSDRQADVIERLPRPFA